MCQRVRKERITKKEFYDRIRARLIYRRWALYSQVRWIPPYGWITKAAALGLFYRSGPVTFGMDLGKPGGDMTVVAWRRGREVIDVRAIELPTEPEILDAVRRKAERFRDIYEELILRIARGEK